MGFNRDKMNKKIVKLSKISPLERIYRVVGRSRVKISSSSEENC